MERHGFINDSLDVKMLILFVMDKVLYPVSDQQLYELCLQDDKLSYIEVLQAIPELVASGHLETVEGGYAITEKGRKITEITNDSLAFPVRQRAERAVERFNREVRRGGFVRTEVLPQPGGEALAVMHLDDEIGLLMTLELTASSGRSATLLTKAFRKKADRIFKYVMTELTSKDEEEEEES